MNSDRLFQHIEFGETDGHSHHFLVPLVGRFKGEYEYQMRVFTIAKKTRYGIHIWRWVERLVKVLKVEGKHNCPAFCN